MSTSYNHHHKYNTHNQNNMLLLSEQTNERIYFDYFIFTHTSERYHDIITIVVIIFFYKNIRRIKNMKFWFALKLKIY